MAISNGRYPEREAELSLPVTVSVCSAVVRQAPSSTLKKTHPRCRKITCAPCIADRSTMIRDSHDPTGDFTSDIAIPDGSMRRLATSYSRCRCSVRNGATCNVPGRQRCNALGSLCFVFLLVSFFFTSFLLLF